MRLLFFLGVLSAYILAAPCGRPEVDLFAAAPAAAIQRARDFQEAYHQNRFQDLPSFYPPKLRGDLVGRLLSGVERDAMDTRALSTDQIAQVATFRRRLISICGERLKRGPRAEGEPYMWQTSASPDLPRLFAEILSWMHANGRVSRTLFAFFTGDLKVLPPSYGRYVNI